MVTTLTFSQYHQACVAGAHMSSSNPTRHSSAFFCGLILPPFLVACHLIEGPGCVRFIIPPRNCNLKFLIEKSFERAFSDHWTIGLQNIPVKLWSSNSRFQMPLSLLAPHSTHRDSNIFRCELSNRGSELSSCQGHF